MACILEMDYYKHKKLQGSCKEMHDPTAIKISTKGIQIAANVLAE